MADSSTIKSGYLTGDAATASPSTSLIWFVVPGISGIVLTSDSRDAYLRGLTSALSSAIVYVHGGVETKALVHAFSKGGLITTNAISGLVVGSDRITNTRTAYTAGQPGYPVTASPAYLRGSLPNDSVAPAYIHGLVPATGLTSAYMRGLTSWAASTTAYMSGFGDLISSQHGFLDGKFLDLAWAAVSAYLNAVAVDYELLGTFSVQSALSGDFHRIIDENGEFLIQKDLLGHFTIEYSLEGEVKVLYNLRGSTRD